jgi:uncharacterized protein (UPF0147 family)
MSRFAKVEDSIKYLMDDHMTPRSVREKLSRIVQTLTRKDQDDQTKISMAQADLEDLSSDVNIPPFVRTQLYGIASQLEALGND